MSMTHVKTNASMSGTAVIAAALALSCLMIGGCSPSNEETEAARSADYTEGYNAGLSQGKEDGFAEGRDAGHSEGLEKAATEAESTEAGSVADRTIDTPYYTITLPEAWEGTYEYDYEAEFGNALTAWGESCERVTVTNKADGKTMFTVCCGTDEYAGGGNGLIEKEIGRTSSDPGYRVLLGRMIYSNTESEGGAPGSAYGPDRTDEYLKYITIK